MDTAMKLLLFRARRKLCTVLYSRLLARIVSLFDYYSTGTIPAPYENTSKTCCNDISLMCDNKHLDALANIIKTSKQHIPKYVLRYSQVFMHTDG